MKVMKRTFQGTSRSVCISAMAVFRKTWYFPRVLFCRSAVSIMWHGRSTTHMGQSLEWKPIKKSFSFENDFLQLGAADTEISAPSAKKRKLQKAVSLKPEAGPNIACMLCLLTENLPFQLMSLPYFIQLHHFQFSAFLKLRMS